MDVDIVANFSRISIGALFVVSGVIKMHGRAAFRTSLAVHTWLPRRLQSGVSITVPMLEILVGALLISGIMATYTMIASFALLFVFSIFAAVSLYRGIDHDCGCFGHRLSSVSEGYRILVRNGVLLIANAMSWSVFVFSG